jgi:hypothetical protein
MKRVPIPALLSLACAGGAGAYAIALGGRFAGGTVALVASGVALLAVGLILRWPNTVPWSVVAVAGGYVVARSGHVTVDGWAAAVGTALLAAAELAIWSIEHDARIPEEPAVRNHRIATLAALLAAALLLDVLVVASAAVSGSSGLLLAAVGVAAAVAAVAVVLRLVRTA